eukprot:CAMPEP_0119338046 /NCGR_PEP_ID=MMETSP1333-20130426/95236_1 /TAXON_ID=418940 /ORGANISM="Scyphosphaera apsteinii, Strain RCC1455" /LENGTH=762 /DNA_ID=CAMNT_0007349231 /DNA_START=68 /DNA_END=2356 /DNA_ORIENTATION=-
MTNEVVSRDPAQIGAAINAQLDPLSQAMDAKVMTDPLVSVLLLTCNRNSFAALALRQIMRQDYPNLEVVVVDDGPGKATELAESLQSLHEVKISRPSQAFSNGLPWTTLPFLGDSKRLKQYHITVKLVVLSQQTTIGLKRNIGVIAAAGQVIVHWDDDDLFSVERVRLQALPILRNDAAMTMLTHKYFSDLTSDGGFFAAQALQEGDTTPFLGSLAYRKSLAVTLEFSNVSLAEDLHFVDRALSACNRLIIITGVDSVFSRHATNSWQWKFVTDQASGRVTTTSTEVNKWVSFTRIDSPSFMGYDLLKSYMEAQQLASASTSQCKALNSRLPNNFAANNYPFMPSFCCATGMTHQDGCKSTSEREEQHVHRRSSYIQKNSAAEQAPAPLPAHRQAQTPQELPPQKRRVMAEARQSRDEAEAQQRREDVEALEESNRELEEEFGAYEKLQKRNLQLNLAKTSPPVASATADVHFTGLRGGKFDMRGVHDKIYALLSASGLAVNARFKETTFTLSPDDIRSSVVKRVHGSVLSEAYIVMRLPSGRILNVLYSPDTPFIARVQMIADEQAPDELWLDQKSSPRADFEDAVHLAIVKAAPVALNVQDGAWNITICPGLYRLADGSADNRVDVSIVPKHAAFLSRVAAHGIIGQSLHDPVAIQGKIDTYTPDANGEYTTSAQGEGAIEGNVRDYEISGGSFGTAFHFDRFDASAAVPRDVSLLSGKRVTSAAHLGGYANGDSPQDEDAVQIFKEMNHARQEKLSRIK